MLRPKRKLPANVAVVGDSRVRRSGDDVVKKLVISRAAQPRRRRVAAAGLACVARQKASFYRPRSSDPLPLLNVCLFVFVADCRLRLHVLRLSVGQG